mgnify:CR=1 FL=1
MSLELEEETLKKMCNLHFPEYVLKMRQYAKENNVPIIQDEGLSFLISQILDFSATFISKFGVSLIAYRISPSDIEPL